MKASFEPAGINQGKSIRTVDQACAFLQGLISPQPRPYALRASFALQSVQQLLARVGNPHHHLRIVHITGSKGKGSTALLTEAILQASGRRTGTFTSPHLQRWTERFRINGRELDEERFVAVLEQLRPHIEAQRADHPDNPPSFFDAATVLALLLFQQANVDYAIMEVGLGGRIDATNVVQPAVTCITSIELEHTDKLGDSLAAIAREKAGIIKPGIPAVLGLLPPAAEREIVMHAASMSAPLIRLGSEIQMTVTACEGPGLSLQLNFDRLNFQAVLPMLGQHLAQNAALAAACVHQLGVLGPDEFIEATCRGLADAYLPGRCEVLCRRPWIMVDAAHTQVSAQALARTLAAVGARHNHLMLSVSTDKDLQSCFAPLLSIAHEVTVTRADPIRSLDPDVLAEFIRAYRPGLTVRTVADPILAVRSACQTLAAESSLCITGSVYMAGVARTALAEDPAAYQEAV